MDPAITPPPAASDESSAAAGDARFHWALGAMVAVFGAVRFACLFNDLWLDEI
jgi:hypothetical protein